MDKELKAGGGSLRNKTLDYNNPNSEVQHGYIQKSKREGIWNKHVKPRELPVNVQIVPLTSSQVVGWRKPIDNLMTELTD